MLPCPPSSLPYLIEIIIARRMVDLYNTVGGLEKCNRPGLALSIFSNTEFEIISKCGAKTEQTQAFIMRKNSN